MDEMSWDNCEDLELTDDQRAHVESCVAALGDTHGVVFVRIEDKGLLGVQAEDDPESRLVIFYAARSAIEHAIEVTREQLTEGQIPKGVN